MLKGRRLIAGMLSLCLALPALAQEQASQPGTLRGPYMGQKAPGSTPEYFADGFVNTPMNMHGNIVFSPDGNEAFWHPDEPKGLYHSKLTAGVWTAPEEVSFADGEMHDAPCYSHDGRRLYFSAGPLSPPGKTEQERFYCVEREADGWSQARLLDTVFDAFSVHWQFSVDRSGGLYFGGKQIGEDIRADIWLSKYENGKYAAPVKLPETVDTENGEFSPCLAPDGSYLIFNRAVFKPGVPPSFALYISFRTGDGAWTEAQGLDDVLMSQGHDLNARVSPDGKYLFFLSMRDGKRGTFWVDAEVLEALRPAGN